MRIKYIASLVAFLLVTTSAVSGHQGLTFKSGAHIVAVDVVVHDDKGNPVRGLTKDDFQVFEDGKPQSIQTFTFEEITAKAAPILETSATLGAAAAKLNGAAKPAAPKPAVPKPAAPAAAAAPAPKPVDADTHPLTSDDVAGHRMLTMLFDVSSMEPEDVQRAIDSALKYVDGQMTNADLVAVAVISSTLQVLQDFTTDKVKVHNALAKLSGSDGTAATPIDSSTSATDEANATSTDDSTTVDPSSQELDTLNNDVRLRAMKTICDNLAVFDQKKAMLDFASGMTRSGMDNQVELRAATSACSKANVAIYTMDTRGLQAIPPGGSARTASRSGAGQFSGANVRGQFSSLQASQETLNTLASDTGGTAFTDTNNFGELFDKVTKDFSAYYILGYASAAVAKDGKFHRIDVKLKSDKLGKIDKAREGYYAETDFEHAKTGDREQLLQDQLYAGIPATDVPVFLTADYFRLATKVQVPNFGGRGRPGGGPGGGGPTLPKDDHNFYVPISVTVPGSAIPPSKDKITLDIRGYIQDERRQDVGSIKDTITVPPMTPEELAAHPVLYQTGLILGAGHYTIKVVVRENTTGQMGSFEALAVVPDMATTPVKVSSVILSTQLAQIPATAKPSQNPLIHDGTEIIPNLTHVVTKDQKLYLYYEVYDPSGGAAPQLRTSLAFYRHSGNSRIKVFETPVVERTSIDAADRKAAIFQFEVPASEFKTGLYECQVNIVDEVAGQFAFPRLQLFVK